MKEKAIINEEATEKDEKKKGKEEVVIKYGFIALGIILAVCIAAFAVISILPNNLISVGDEKISEEEFDYHYFEQANMLYQQILAYYPDVSLEVFMLSEYTSGMTYHEFAKQLALERVSDIYILMDMAEEEGYVYDETEFQDSKDTFKTSFEEYATQLGLTNDEAAKEIYGSKFSVVIKIYESTWISSKYQADKLLEYEETVEEDQMIEYHANFADDLDIVTLKQLFIATYDTELQAYYDDAALADAKARAEALVERINNGEDYDALLMEFSEDPAVEDTLGEYASRKSEIGLPELEEWAFSTDRTEGDTGLIETQIGFHIVKYGSRTGFEDAKDEVRSNIAYGIMLDLLTKMKNTPKYEIGYYKEFSRY